MSLFLPLVKADQVNHLVYARAAAEEPDKSGEIMDYVTAKPQFQAWSKRFSDATMGKSYGNVRSMHNPKHLAGKVQKLDFDDDTKSVNVCIKVLDPVDWIKVEEGGYTGISIGGGYHGAKWPDPLHKGFMRYTPRIGEISFVDAPCIPSALIMEMQKMDGTVEEVLLKGMPRTFAALTPPRTFDEMEKGSGIFGAGLATGAAIGIGSSIIHGGAPRPRHGLLHHAFWTAATGGTPYLGYLAGRGLTSRARAPEGATPKVPKVKTPVALKQEILGNLAKAWDGTKHPREHTGAFATKPVEQGGRFVGGAAGAVGGALLGAMRGPQIGEAIGRKSGVLYGAASDRIRGQKISANAYRSRGETAEMIGGRAGRLLGGKYGSKAGGLILGLGGALIGAAGGSIVDTIMRRRRAKKAGKLDQYKRLNAKSSVLPSSAKQTLRSAREAMIAANKARHFHQMTSDIFKQEILGNLEKAGLSGLAAYTERAASQGKTMIPAVEGGVRSFLDGHNKLFQYGTAATKKIPKIVSHYIDGRGKTFSVMKQREEILDHLEKAGLPGAFSRSRQPRRFIGGGVAVPSAAATGAEVTAARNATHHIRSPFPSAAAGAALDNPGLPGRYPTRQNPPSGDNRAVPLGKAATAEERAKIAQVMHEHKAGTLRSYRGVNPTTGKPRKGPKVTDRKQAIAIALSQASRLGKMHDPVLVAALTDRLEKVELAQTA